MLPFNNVEVAMDFAERIRRNIETASIKVKDGVVSVTVSMGVANMSEKLGDGGALMKASDRATYIAKETGRNKVVCFLES